MRGPGVDRGGTEEEVRRDERDREFFMICFAISLIFEAFFIGLNLSSAKF